MPVLDFSVNLKISAVFGGAMQKTTSEEKVIFVKCFRHWRTGKMVYPKNGKVIAIRLKEKPKK
jgi:hypothetical protein